VRDQLGIETEVGAVLLDLLTDKGTELTGGEGLLLINLSDLLGVRDNNLGTGQPGVVGGHERSPLLGLHADVVTQRPRDLVLVGVLELATRVDANDTAVGTLDLVDLVHGLLVLLGDDLVGTIHSLTVLTGLETPLDVLGRSRIEVVIDVGESVLLNVGDTDVLVLVDLTGGGDKLTSQDVNESGLASTVGTDDGNTGTKGNLEGNSVNLGLRSTGVLEGHVGNTANGLGLGLDTLKETGLGELELHLGGTELVVGLGSGVSLDEVGKGTAVTAELEALVVNNVLDDVVKELGVVRHHDGSARGVLQVVLEPSDVLDVQVVGRLIKQENIGRLEDSTAESELHLPTTGEGSDRALNLERRETELVEQLILKLLTGRVLSNLSKLLLGPGNDGLLGIGRVEIVLDVNGLDLILLGETLKLLVVDGTHEGGLSGTVGAEETVTLTTLEMQVSLVQQNLGTVSKGECAVAKVNTFLLIGGDGIGSGSVGAGLLAEGLSDGLGISLTNDSSDVRDGVLGPDDVVVLLLVNELSGNGSNVVDGLLGGGDEVLVLSLEDGLEDTSDGGDVTSAGDLGDLSINDVTDTAKSVKSLAGLLTGLGVGKSLVVLVQAGQHLRQERSDELGVLHELTHVVDNDSGLTLDGGLTLNETTVKQGNHDSEGRASDISNESGGTEQVNGLGDVLGLGDTLDQLGDETLNILVDDQTADLLHGGVGSLLDLGLGVPHSLGDNGDQGRDLVTKLHLSGLNKDVDAVESSHLFGPLLGVGKRIEDRGDNGLDGVTGNRLDDSDSGGLGGLLDGDDLVTDGGEDGAEESNKVGLNTGSDCGVRGNSTDTLAGTLTGDGVLLVGELLLEDLSGLSRENLLGDGTTEEGGKVAGSSVGLIGAGGDVEVLDQVLEDSDRLGGLLASDGRRAGDVGGRHFGSNFGGFLKRRGY